MMPATDVFIRDRLDPNLGWSGWVSLQLAFALLEEEIQHCDANAIAQAILQMNYDEFLKTPYWTAVADKVKRDAREKCMQCGSGGILQAHHGSYDIHGYELQRWKELGCLCHICHAKTHGKAPKNLGPVKRTEPILRKFFQELCPR